MKLFSFLRNKFLGNCFRGRFLIALWILGPTCFLKAQLVADGQTFVLTTGTNFAGNFTVGSNGSNTILQIVGPGGKLTNFVGFIGSNVSSANNFVIVSGLGASWTNGGELNVGAFGSFNTLLITNGGIVSSTRADVGDNVRSVSNAVVVAGSGSLWNVGTDILTVGLNGSFNRLLITNGGKVVNQDGFLGYNVGSTNNQAIVTGTGSSWICNILRVGFSGRNNTLLINDGGRVENTIGEIGSGSSLGASNLVVVSGSGSSWINRNTVYVGIVDYNTLVITNGGMVTSPRAVLGIGPYRNNRAIVTGMGSVWSNHTDFSLQGGPLVITDGGAVFSGGETRLLSGNDIRLEVNGGFMTNAGLFHFRRGTFQLDAGWVSASNFLVTLPTANLAFNGGTLSVGKSTVGNGQPFMVGDGNQAAVFDLIGHGLHSHTNGLFLSSYAVLRGNGTIQGPLTASAGATVSPGASIGKLTLDTTPVLQGVCLMEISGNTNDQLEVTDLLIYAGSLVVTNLGPGVLALGDSFRLFNAPGYSSVFDSIQLPPLAPGLSWTNRLMEDGSIAVVSEPGLVLESVALTSTNLTFNCVGGPPSSPHELVASTNLALPMPSWTVITTGNFDLFGNASISVPIDPVVPMRFFRLRLP